MSLEKSYNWLFLLRFTRIKNTKWSRSIGICLEDLIYRPKRRFSECWLTMGSITLRLSINWVKILLNTSRYSMWKYHHKSLKKTCIKFRVIWPIKRNALDWINIWNTMVTIWRWMHLWCNRLCWWNVANFKQ
jgi:hypothetical protein